MNNSGWGCPLIALFGVLILVSLALGAIDMVSQDAQTDQQQAENIGLLAEDIGKSLDIIEKQSDAIVADNQAERRQNDLLTIGLIVAVVVILVLVLRSRGARREA